MNNRKIFVLISPKNRTSYNFRGDLIKDMIKLGYTVYVTGPNRIDVDKIEQLGARFIEIQNDKNGVNIIADVRYFLQLLKLFKKIKPTITLGYTVKPVIYTAIAARLAGVKSINSMITGVGYLFISKSKRARILKYIVLILYRIGLKCASNVIFQNPDDLNEFVDNKLVSRDKTYIVNGSGVDMSRFRVAPMPEKLTFFMLSRMMYSKGVMEYAMAAEILKREFPDVRFMMLGAFENIQDSIPERQFRERFIDSEILDYSGETNDVVSFIAQSSVYVLPSYREGTPRTVLEAMSMGRPIITTDTPGCRETVVDGHNGFLLPVKDVNALVFAMRKFIEDQSRVSVMGRASENYCSDKYRVEIVNREMIKIMI